MPEHEVELREIDPQRIRLTSEEAEVLRRQHYNATLIERLDIHEELARFRIRPDSGVPSFEPGQYVALGLGYWESRLPGTQPEVLSGDKLRKVVRRAYSIACPMVDGRDRLLPCGECGFLEFYVTLIRHAEQPPALTPRLFDLKVGDRLFVQPRVVGTYTLAGVGPADAVVFLGTGTGEAPHNAMATELLARGHQGRIVVATCARLHVDFGYRREHEVLKQKFKNYCYLTYTTRERRNLDPSSSEFVGVERLQTMFGSGRLEQQASLRFSPQQTHIFLCGNPAMIGLRRPTDPPLDQPGMLQMLTQRGFRSLYPVPDALANSDARPHTEVIANKEVTESDASAMAGSESDEAPGQIGPGVVRYEKYW